MQHAVTLFEIHKHFLVELPYSDLLWSNQFNVLDLTIAGGLAYFNEPEKQHVFSGCLYNAGAGSLR